MKMITRTDAQTIEYAREFAKQLRGGEVIGLIGDLGSGKTTFVKGLAWGLGIKDVITSPTFVILKEYTILPLLPRTRNAVKVQKLVHIDAYRLENIEDAKSIGLEDYLNQKDNVVVIEWAGKIRKILPGKTIFIYFKHLNEKERRISISHFSCDRG